MRRDPLPYPFQHISTGPLIIREDATRFAPSSSRDPSSSVPRSLNFLTEFSWTDAAHGSGPLGELASSGNLGSGIDNPISPTAFGSTGQNPLQAITQAASTGIETFSPSDFFLNNPIRNTVISGQQSLLANQYD